ncbi:MAG: hypothetical protein DI556_17485 [Rhodovulum sulfidophilum]|uniref:ABC transporter substrate-binding protein n=1 Tax=Rhodovulum sulfidophilum TaxID=35806 RepID=A0A2W5PRE7_RHOSU|nr:MAG: hypothetical protein DI556_17485 [Rhodovulum sulfidophilum]
MSVFPGAPLGRRGFLKTGAALAATAALPPVWARAQTVPAIPETTVRFGGFAVTNHCWTVLAAQKGFLKDNGITMAGGVPKSLLETQVVPQLMNGELDITSYWFGLAIQQLDRVPDLHPILVYSYFQGSTIVGDPAKYKSVDEFMAEGMAWPEAAKAAIEQMRGKKFAITASPSTHPWNEFALGLGGMTMADTDTIPVEDPKAVQLAISNGIDFAAPGGAVQIYQLQFQAGWKPIMSTRQMVKYMASGTGSPLNSLLNYDLIQTTGAYLENNRDTVYRFVGGMYRTLDYIFGPNQTQALTEYAPFINAQTGAQMDAESIKFIFEDLDPFFQWKDQSKVWEDESYALNYKNIYTYQIQQFVKAGTIPDEPYDLDRIFAAKGIWQEMAGMKDRTEALLGKVSATDTVGPERQALIDQAKAHLANFNFLDAERFAQAATA